MKNKYLKIIVLLIGFSSMLVATSSMAYHGRSPWRHQHHSDQRFWGGLVLGLAAGAVVVGLATAANNYPPYHPYYSRSCRRVSYQRSCHYNRWNGVTRCWRTRVVHYVC